MRNDINETSLHVTDATSMSFHLHRQALTSDASRLWDAVPAAMDFTGCNPMEMRSASLPSHCPVCRHGKSTIEKGGAFPAGDLFSF